MPSNRVSVSWNELVLVSSEQVLKSKTICGATTARNPRCGGTCQTWCPISMKHHLLHREINRRTWTRACPQIQRATLWLRCLLREIVPSSRILRWLPSERSVDDWQIVCFGIAIWIQWMSNAHLIHPLTVFMKALIQEFVCINLLPISSRLFLRFKKGIFIHFSEFV